MATTDKGAPYPVRADPNNAPLWLQRLAEWVTARPGVTAMSTAQRDALTGSDLWQGRVIANTTTGLVEQRVGTRWDPTGRLAGLSHAQISALTAAELTAGRVVLDTNTQSPAFVGSDAVVRQHEAWVYGDASDGDVTITGSVTLTRAMHYRNLTLTASGSIDTAGHRIHVHQTLTMTPGSIIRNNATSSAPGAAAPGAPATFSSVGGGSVSGSPLYAAGNGGGGGFGGQGSNSSGAGPGSSGEVGSTAADVARARSLLSALTYAILSGARGGRGGASGGRDSASGTTVYAGTGGYGGGVVQILARIITGAGTIEARGSDGAPGATNTSGDGGGAGGGGGGGGVVIIGTSVTPPPAIVIRAPGGLGGAGAAGSQGATSGNAGSQGLSGLVSVTPLAA